MEGAPNIFNEGDLVFAKIKFFPAWPARVSEILPHNRIEVVFFGDFNKAVVTPDKLTPYSEQAKLLYDVESSRRRVNFKDAMQQIEEAHLDSRAGFQMSHVFSENISDDESSQQNMIQSASVVQALDDEDRFWNRVRSKIDNLKKALANNQSLAKQGQLINYQVALTANDLKYAASIDEPDPDHALEILEHFIAEVLPKTTRSQLLENPELVEDFALLTEYNGNDESWEFNEALKQIVQAKVAKIRDLAVEALETIKDLYPSLDRNNPKVWKSFVFQAAILKAIAASQVPSSLTQ